MSEFSELWKHPNNPSCSKSVKVFMMFKLDTNRRKSAATPSPTPIPPWKMECYSKFLYEKEEERESINNKSDIEKSKWAETQ